MGDVRLAEDFLPGNIWLKKSGEKGAPSRVKNVGNLLLSSTHHAIMTDLVTETVAVACVLAAAAAAVTECKTVEINARSRKFITDTMCMRLAEIRRPPVDTTYSFRTTQYCSRQDENYQAEL